MRKDDIDFYGRDDDSRFYLKKSVRGGVALPSVLLNLMVAFSVPTVLSIPALIFGLMALGWAYNFVVLERMGGIFKECKTGAFLFFTFPIIVFALISGTMGQ